MNDLQIYVYSGEQLRTVHQPDGLWWVLRDVCRVLGMSNPAMVAQRLDEDEKGEVSLSYISSNGVEQKRATTIINEPGLYAVILRSDKPEAREFKRWVAHEVLPSIRKTGAYGVPSKKLEHLNELQDQLDVWRELTKKFECYTSEDCRRAQEARQRYDKTRATRDECRRQVKYFEQMISDEIKSLEIE